MTNKKIMAVVVMVCFCAFLSFAGDKEKMDPAAHAAKLKAELNLTAEQTTQVEKVIADSMKKMEPIRTKGQTAQEELKALKSANSPDATAIQAKENEVQQIREQKKAALADRDAAMKKILTPEQFAKYQELVTAHSKHQMAGHPK